QLGTVGFRFGGDMRDRGEFGLRQCLKRRQRAAGRDRSDGGNADNVFRFDECDPNPGAVPFLTGATLNQTTGPAVTTVMAPTTSITGLQPGATNNLIVPAFDPNANPSNTFFAFANGSNTTKGSGGVELVNTNTPTPTITLTNTTVVSGTVAPPQTVVMNVSAPQSQFLTSASLTTSTSPTNAITSVTPTSAQFVSGLNVSTANVLT